MNFLEVIEFSYKAIYKVVDGGVMPKKKLSKFSKTGAMAMTVGRFLLDQLLELGEIFPRPFETPYSYKRRMSGWPKEIPAYRVRQELQRMKQRGWLKEVEKQGKKFLKLTEKGRLRALYKKLETLGQSPKKVWDGKWRIAIFDIPEKGRRERDAIRWVLQSVGFYQLQKSVYIYPHEIPGDVINYLKISGLLSFIRFARVDKMDDVADLKKYFKL